MKKFIVSLAALFFVTTSAQAQTYTLQASPNASVNNASVIINNTQPKKTNSFGEAFCSGMSDFYRPVSSFSSKSVRTINNSLLSASALSAMMHYDPYLIEIDGTRYMMIKDNGDDKFDRNDILGISDTTQTVFSSLKPLDFNGDKKLTGEELSKANIRLVKIDENGKLLYQDKLQDFDNSNIVFIHISELRKSYKNDGKSGDFGFYDVVIKNKEGKKQLVTGVVTFESEEKIQKYFG